VPEDFENSTGHGLNLANNFTAILPEQQAEFKSLYDLQTKINSIP
jgi:hypothetical protein